MREKEFVMEMGGGGKLDGGICAGWWVELVSVEGP